MNVNVFNLMFGVNETRFLVQHESCECKRGLKEKVRNSKQEWNHSECWCECKELDGWGSCKNYYIGILACVVVNVIKHAKLMNI